MPSKNLTTVAIEKLARPTTGRVEVSDVEKGLFLHVSASGSKRFIVIYRMPGAEGKAGPREKIVLGAFPSCGIAEARAKAREIAALVKAGKDPKTAKVEKEQTERAESFGAVASAFVAAMKANKQTGGRSRPVTAATAQAREAKLKNYILPVLGTMPLSAVDSKVIGRLLTAIEAKGGPVDETLKVIRGVFSFAASRAVWNGQAPTAGMRKRQPKTEKARPLADQELTALWSAAEAYGYPFGHCIRLLMLTGQRRDEIGEARWDWVDWDRKILTVPGSHTKNRKGDHEVPLSDAAMAVLTEARAAYLALGLNSGFIFTSGAGTTAISGWAKVVLAIDREMRGCLAGIPESEMRSLFSKGAQGEVARAKKAAVHEKLKAVDLKPWRLHDLRHSVVTRLRAGEENDHGEVTWAPALDVVQAVVGHEITAGVTKVYDHSDLQRRYRLQKRQALDWWARRLHGIVSGETSGAKIVPFRTLG